MSRLSLALFTVLLLSPVTTFAAEQTVLGSQLSVKNPSTLEKRKVSVSAKEVGSTNTIVGDPVANGATVTIRMSGGTVAGETYNLPAGTSPTTSKPFWTGDAVKGFKYKDAKGENGPLSAAAFSLKGGKLQIKIALSGKLGTIDLVPPNPGADGCTTLTFNGGDSYSINFASGTAKNSGAKGFKMSKPTAEGPCILPNPNNLPIDHIIVLMQENRSADHYLAQLSVQGQPAYEAEPMTGNPDPTNPMGPPILPFHKTNYCEVFDLDHSWKGTHAEVNGGLMNGFTTRNAMALDPTGSRAMGYYDQTDLPFYYGLYSTFATGDRYFCSVLSQTYPNRLYGLAASSFGYIRNDVLDPLPNPSIFNLLDQAGITWRIYASQYPLAYASVLFRYVADRASTRVLPLSQYYVDLANGTLPNVAFVDPNFIETATGGNDEHPPVDVQLGQKFVADVVNALMASPVWATSAMFLTYDEHGGFYDHVVPPPAPAPDGILPFWQGGDPHALFDQYGVRVPAVVISPYSKASFVSHVVHDHTSILKFIETRFALPSLTNRDAAADPMLEFFDFNTAAFAIPPSLPAAVIDQAHLDACPG